MLVRLVKLGVQIVTDEIEAVQSTKRKMFDWNIVGWDKSRPAMTRSNGESIDNPEHICRKLKTILKG
ncbi:MAG: hypothetical protein QNJ47_15275 [Nostocaceae cyanobacterium]|nr:hypothetical protein [Nostocaceae cyanobacterium]